MLAMRNFYAIYRKELGHYFASPIAYVVIGFFLFFSGLMFSYFLSYLMMAQQRAAFSALQMGMPPNMDVPGAVMGAQFNLFSTMILFFIPLLTMGVYAEERKRGTMELLMTSPVSELQIVLGKYFATLTLFALMVLPSILYLAYMLAHSDPASPWRLLFISYAGVLLLGGAFIALGTFISSLTENQLIASVITFTAFLFVFVINVLGNADSSWSNLFQYLSITKHYEDLTRGIIDASGLVYFLSFTVFFIFLTVRSVDSMRWRRA
jgi:ABC-2 type transport system permease protein